MVYILNDYVSIQMKNLNKKYSDVWKSGRIVSWWLRETTLMCIFGNRQLQNVSCFVNSLFQHKFYSCVKFHSNRFYYFSCSRKLFHKYRLLLVKMFFFLNQDPFQDFNLFAKKLVAKYTNVREIQFSRKLHLKITFWT